MSRGHGFPLLEPKLWQHGDVCIAGFSASPVQGAVPSEQTGLFQDGLPGGGLGLFPCIRQKPSALVRNEQMNEWDRRCLGGPGMAEEPRLAVALDQMLLGSWLSGKVGNH